MSVDILLAPHGPEDLDMVELMVKKVETALEENPNNFIHLILENPSLPAKNIKIFENLCNTNTGVLPSIAYISMVNSFTDQSTSFRASSVVRMGDVSENDHKEHLKRLGLDEYTIRKYTNLDRVFMKYAKPLDETSKGDFSSRLKIYFEDSRNRGTFDEDTIIKGYGQVMKSFFTEDLEKSVEHFKKISFEFARDIYKRDHLVAKKVKDISKKGGDEPVILFFGSTHSFIKNHISNLTNGLTDVRKEFLELTRSKDYHLQFDVANIVVRKIINDIGINKDSNHYTRSVLTNDWIPSFINNKIINTVMSELEWSQATLIYVTESYVNNLLISFGQKGITEKEEKSLRQLLNGITDYLPKIFNTIESIERLNKIYQKDPITFLEEVQRNQKNYLQTKEQSYNS